MTARRRKRGTLLHTKSGDFDATWILLLILSSGGLLGFLVETFKSGHATNAAWAWLAATQAAVLLAAIPVSKARLIASATLPGSIVTPIAGAITGITHAVQTTETKTTVDAKPEAT